MDIAGQYEKAMAAKEAAAEEAPEYMDREAVAKALAGSRKWGLATQEYLTNQVGTEETLKAKCKRVRGSDRLMFCVSMILGVDWVTNSRAYGGLNITSDGFVVSGGLFIGSISDLQRNLEGYMEAAELTESERSLFSVMFSMNVQDWRRDPPPGYRGHYPT